MCSCSSRIVVLAPTLLCCAALLRPQIAVWLHPTASVLCSRSNAVQSPAPSISHYREAPLAVLANHAQQTRHLQCFVLQPTSAASHHPGQLRFREELMHELLAQLSPDQKPQRASARPNPAHSMAKDHFPKHTELERECVLCRQQSGNRKRSRIICAECGVHLCIGECFSLYHA